MASTRTKVLAADGQFDVRATSPGTEVTVCIPLADVSDSAPELATL
jgi:two-component system NarL family sensor kinase